MMKNSKGFPTEAQQADRERRERLQRGKDRYTRPGEQKQDLRDLGAEAAKQRKGGKS